MAGQDEQAPPAHRIANTAIDLRPVSRVVRDAAPVLRVLRVPEQHDALDLLLHRGVQLAHARGHDRRALAVAAGDDTGIGALLVGHVEEALGLVDGGLARALREEVGGQVGGVRAADALHPDVVAVLRLELSSYGGAGADALVCVRNLVLLGLSGGSGGGGLRGFEILTILPGSVEARAKMKITLGQSELEPRSSSFRVLESWRGATGLAAARPAAKARMAETFIVDVDRGASMF